MKFNNPHILYYVDSLDESRAFYEKLGFQVTFTAEAGGQAVHHELLLDGFTLGIATKEAAMKDHGLTPGPNEGCELVLWAEDADSAVEFLLGIGATLISEPHNFLDNKLRAGWVRDPNGNPIQIVCKNSRG